MPKVLVADEISKEGIAILNESAAVSYEPKISAADLESTIADYDGLLVRSRSKVTAAIINAGKKLKIIGRAGVGVDNIDVPSATEAGILVVNSPEGNTASAAELTITLMLSLSRMIPTADQSVKAGLWERSKFTGSELFNKTLAIIGLGKIGSRVAHTAQALGMKVIVYDPFITPERAQELNLQIVSLDDIWQQADYITLHTPKTRDTANLINKDVLSKIKPGVRIINASRGGIIDEKALAEAIVEGKVAGAALDVYDKEPPENSPLFQLKEKVVLTPHLGASTMEAQFNVAIDLAEQMRDYLSGGMARSPVNLPSMRPDLLKSLGKYFWLAEAIATIAGGLTEGTPKEIEIIVYGSLAQKDITPLTVAALRGIFAGKMEGVTYVNALSTARQHGIQVKDTKIEESGKFGDELSIVISTDSTNNKKSAITGTVLPHNEAIITKINDYPINLTPSKYMLFTSHKDQPGMVAKIAGVLGACDINISTMSLGRREIRQDAVMVMALDDLAPPKLLQELNSNDSIHTARFVSLEHMPWKN